MVEQDRVRLERSLQRGGIQARLAAIRERSNELVERSQRETEKHLQHLRDMSSGS